MKWYAYSYMIVTFLGSSEARTCILNQESKSLAVFNKFGTEINL